MNLMCGNLTPSPVMLAASAESHAEFRMKSVLPVFTAQHRRHTPVPLVCTSHFPHHSLSKSRLSTKKQDWVVVFAVSVA